MQIVDFLKIEKCAATGVFGFDTINDRFCNDVD